MTYKVKLISQVRADLLEAKEWYQQHNATLAEDFKIAVNNEIDYISKFPNHYQIKYKDLRQSLVIRFPYAIYYLVNEEQKLIVVLGILHTKRNPNVIKKRII